MDEQEQFIELEEVKIKAWEEDVGEFAKDPLSTTSKADDSYIALGTNRDKDSMSGNITPGKLKSLAMQYGNNIFALSVDGNSIIAVLKDLPALHSSAVWQTNGNSTLQQALLNLQNNELYQQWNNLLGAPQIPVIAAGTSTTRSYQSTEHCTFKLDFRIYSQEPIGPGAGLTGYQRALTMLSMYAPPLHTLDADNTLDYLAANLGSTLHKALQVLSDVEDFVIEKTHNVAQSEQNKIPETSTTGAGVKQSINLLSTTGKDAYNFVASDTTEEAKASAKALQLDLANILDSIQSFAQGNLNNEVIHNDLVRTTSSKNTQDGIFGGAIWNLTLYPGVFSHNIPVYIQSWTATPSKEIDSSGKALYYDFSVNCIMDQIKSASWWVDQIYSDDYVTYKNNFARRNAEV